MVNEPSFTHSEVIDGSAAEVWDALVNPEKTVQYFFGTLVSSDWMVGSDIVYRYPDGQLVSTGEVLSIEPPHRLEVTFHAKWDAEIEAEGPVREVWTIEPNGSNVRLTVDLFDAPEGSKTLTDFASGFPHILGGLKALVEDGISNDT